MSKNSEVLIIVPVFNEELNLYRVVNDLKEFFENIVVVDDGSNDNTHNIIKTLKVNYIKHSLNLGQGAAIESGFKFLLENTNCTYGITFDGDGQNRAIDAEMMIKTAKKKNLDAVIGSRFLKSELSTEIPFFRKIILKCGNIYEKLFYSIKFSDSHNGLRVLSRNLIKNFILPIRNHDMSHATEISYKICKSNCIFEEFPIKVLYKNKRSQNSLNAINIVIKNFLRPFN